MADEPTTSSAPEPEPAEQPGPNAGPETDQASTTAGEAWAEVVTRMGELSDAVSAWARAAADNPENRRHLDDVRNGVNNVAKEAAAAFDSVTSTDFGQQVKSGAEEAGTAIGDAAQKVSDAAAPHVATAFAGLAGVFGRAAQKVEEAAARQKDSAGAAESEATASDGTAAPKPPAPPAPPVPDE